MPARACRAHRRAESPQHLIGIKAIDFRPFPCRRIGSLRLTRSTSARASGCLPSHLRTRCCGSSGALWHSRAHPLALGRIRSALARHSVLSQIPSCRTSWSASLCGGACRRLSECAKVGSRDLDANLLQKASSKQARPTFGCVARLMIADARLWLNRSALGCCVLGQCRAEESAAAHFRLCRGISCHACRHVVQERSSRLACPTRTARSC